MGTVARPARPQAGRLFDLATTATVVSGVLALYAALFLLAAAAAGVLVVPRLFGTTPGHPVSLVRYLELSWLPTSPATVGGAVGSGLEIDETVCEAAYSYRS